MNNITIEISSKIQKRLPKSKYFIEKISQKNNQENQEKMNRCIRQIKYKYIKINRFISRKVFNFLSDLKNNILINIDNCIKQFNYILGKIFKKLQDIFEKFSLITKNRKTLIFSQNNLNNDFFTKNTDNLIFPQIDTNYKIQNQRKLNRFNKKSENDIEIVAKIPKHFPRSEFFRSFLNYNTWNEGCKKADSHEKKNNSEENKAKSEEDKSINKTKVENSFSKIASTIKSNMISSQKKKFEEDFKFKSSLKLKPTNNSSKKSNSGLKSIKELLD